MSDTRGILDGLAADERARLRPVGGTVPAAMLATLTDERFSHPDWIFERKLDGVRCLATRSAGGEVGLRSRNGLELTGRYPEVAEALAAHGVTDLLVDGEVVAFDGRRTSFERLQGRLGLSDPDAARATGIAVYYYVFDLLQVDGCDVRALPLLTRKRLLRKAIAFADPLRFTVHRRTAGEEAWRAACARGDEGVIAKRSASAYAGGRSRDWLKFKCVRDQEFVVGGWTDPQGSRTGLGALLLGYYDGDEFVYAGKVGTGFGDRTLRELARRLAALSVARTPFERSPPSERSSHWVRPELVVQIGFSEWTRDGRLRHPRFLGLREDKAAADVVRETR